MENEKEKMDKSLMMMTVKVAHMAQDQRVRIKRDLLEKVIVRLRGVDETR